MIQVALLIVVLAFLTCCQMLIYDTIKKWYRPFKIFAYASCLWTFPLLATANVSWISRTRPIGAILTAYFLSELSVVFHEVVIFTWWVPRSLEVLIFIRFALVQSSLKLLGLLVASLGLRTGGAITSVCAIGGMLSATLYCVFPLVEGRFYSISLSFIGESILSQSLNLVLGILTGLLIFTSGRFVGIVTALAFDAPAVGAFIWFSFSGKGLSGLYQSLLILGLTLLTSAYYFVAVHRRQFDRPPTADQMPLPVYISGPAVVVS